jgi:shikimate kinase
VPFSRVVLVGMMGAGKTTVGRALAARLGWPYRDNDAALLRLTGRSGPDLLASAGVEALHEAEAAVLLDALAASDPQVVAAPGSAVLSPALRVRLAAEPVVWLRASVATLAARVAADAARPLLPSSAVAGATEAAGAVAALLAARGPGFAEVASYVVDVDGLSPAEVASRIAFWVSEG